MVFAALAALQIGQGPQIAISIAQGDADFDRVPDEIETACGSNANDAAAIPERTDHSYAGFDDDGDTQVDESLPDGSAGLDCDGDGYIGSTEEHVTTGDQDRCGLDGWPSDLFPGGFQPNRINIQDIATFIVPVRRLGKSLEPPGAHERWDLIPGSSFGSDINIEDVAAIVSSAETGFPRMLGGARAYGGPVCPETDSPPPPTDVAPPIDESVATDLASSTSFLFTGDSPIQTDVAPGTIDEQRIAVLRGKVLTETGAPLPGVVVTILDHDEYGQTITRADGMFDMAVNGGGQLTVNYRKSGYLPVQRNEQIPWQDYVNFEDVVMIGYDDQVTTLALHLPLLGILLQVQPVRRHQTTRKPPCPR